MGRMPRAAERLPSQRESRELRELEAQVAALKADIQTHEQSLRAVMDLRNSADSRRVHQLEAELKDLRPPSTDGLSSVIPKIKDTTSTTFYDHVNFGFEWLRRFHVEDVVPITIAAVKKVGRKIEHDLSFALISSKGLNGARQQLLHAHEVKIAKHLHENVYTAEHFSVLRLIVGNMSGRICSLIEQSIKYEHHADGSKRRQMLLPCSRVPAPSIFSLSEINAAERKAEQASGLLLRGDHEDHNGADICSKQFALDRAICDSMLHASRSGGMATAGSVSDPHLICVSGDGARLTQGKSGVRVGHFCGSTNLLNQSSLDFKNWVFYKEKCKAEDYTVLAGRLSKVFPDLRRLYETGELCNEEAGRAAATASPSPPSSSAPPPPRQRYSPPSRACGPYPSPTPSRSRRRSRSRSSRSRSASRSQLAPTSQAKVDRRSPSRPNRQAKSARHSGP